MEPSPRDFERFLDLKVILISLIAPILIYERNDFWLLISVFLKSGQRRCDGAKNVVLSADRSDRP